jgi:DNA-binding GntR family transcriptional regulator
MELRSTYAARTRLSTAEEEAYCHIIACIRTGRYARNDRLVPETIAAEIGMSRMPVREAFRRLATEGLVVIRPNRGCVVSGLTISEIVEVFQIRSALEGLAVRLAAPQLSDAVFDDLNQLLHRMETSEASDTDRWLEDHYRFHDYVCSLSGSQKLIAQIRTLHVSIEPYLRMYRHHAPKQRSAAEAHKILFDALKTRDAEKAEQAMRDHVLGTTPLLAAFLNDGGFLEPNKEVGVARGRKQMD